jgi:TadE-like protein
VRRLRREQAGQASIEFIGSLSLILLSALAMWQMAIVMWTYNQASNAARTASRVDGRGGDARKAARNALSPALRDDLQFELDHGKATVRVLIPILAPGIFSGRLRAQRSAELPAT